MTCCQNEETPIIVMPSLSTLMTSAPTMVPPMVPMPPDMDVPPNTTEAMAFISQLSPAAGCAARSCEVLIIEQIAANSAENM